LGYHADWGVALRYSDELLHGLLITFQLSLAAFALALFVGLVIALLRLSRYKSLNYLTIVYIEVFRGTPEMVQLVWAYYVLPMFFGLPLSSIATGIIVLGFSLSAYLAEVYRAGIESVPGGQVEAARALGLSRTHTFIRIILPQALRVMFAPMLNNYVLLLKRTSLLMAIAVPELMFASHRLSSYTYRPLEILTAAALLYLVITYPATIIVGQIEKRFALPAR